MIRFRPSFLFFTLFCIGMVSTLASCKKIQSKYIMRGDWDVLEVNLNNGTLDQMTQFIPEWQTDHSCCSYIMSFQDEGVCSVVYTVNGDVQYVSSGEWDMPEKSKIYFKVDEYVDGIFDMEKEGDGVWVLHAPTNNIDAYGVGIVDMKIRTKRIKK